MIHSQEFSKHKKCEVLLKIRSVLCLTNNCNIEIHVNKKLCLASNKERVTEKEHKRNQKKKRKETDRTGYKLQIWIA